MRQLREFGDFSESGLALDPLNLLLTFKAFGLLAVALLLSSSAPIIALFTVGPALVLTLVRSPLLLGTILTPPQFAAILARLLLVLLYDDLDHLPKRGPVDTVLLGVARERDVVHPLNCRLLRQPLDLSLQPACTLFIRCGEGNDAFVHGATADVVSVARA